jgi:hypothetical protein
MLAVFSRGIGVGHLRAAHPRISCYHKPLNSTEMSNRHGEFQGAISERKSPAGRIRSIIA